MRETVRRRHNAHVRVRLVCGSYSQLFDAIPGWSKARTSLDACVKEVVRQFRLQGHSIEDGRAAAEQIRVGRQEIRNAILVIVRIGKLVTLDETTMTTLRAPRSVSDSTLTTSARVLLERVRPYADAFVAEGLPPDVLPRLYDLIEQFEAAKLQAVAARERFTAASESIRVTQARADLLVAAIEGIALNTPAAVPAVVTVLRMAKRVGPRASAAKATAVVSAEQVQERPRADAADAVVLPEVQEIDVSGYDKIGTAFDRGRKVFVIVRVVADALKLAFTDDGRRSSVRSVRLQPDFGGPPRTFSTSVAHHS